MKRTEQIPIYAADGTSLGFRPMEAALKLYSQLAQWQFNYADVQVRIKKIREDRKAREGPR